MNHHIAHYRTSLNLIWKWWQDQIVFGNSIGLQRKNMSVSHIKHNFGTKKKQKHKMFSCPSSKTHKIYKGVNESFGVQVNNLK